MTIKTSIVCAIALFAGAAAGETASAQAQPRSPRAFYLAVGASNLANGELDDRLISQGYPSFGETAISGTLGARSTLANGVTISGEWTGLLIGEHAHGDDDVGLGGGYATLGAGYGVALSERAILEPRLGVGVGGFGLWIDREEAAGEDPGIGFDEVLADPARVPARETVLGRDGLVVDLGATLEFVPGDPAGRGPVLGLRTGYLAGSLLSEWSTAGRPISDAPEASLSGPYLRILVGLRR